jgi:hypothetical protein
VAGRCTCSTSGERWRPWRTRGSSSRSAQSDTPRSGRPTLALGFASSMVCRNAKVLKQIIELTQGSSRLIEGIFQGHIDSASCFQERNCSIVFYWAIAFQEKRCLGLVSMACQCFGSDVHRLAPSLLDRVSNFSDLDFRTFV